MRVAQAANPKGTTAMWVRDRLEALWSDEDFVGWYPRDGRPAWSPAQLATVCMGTGADDAQGDQVEVGSWLGWHPLPNAV